jgi:hypothetical protein
VTKRKSLEERGPVREKLWLTIPAVAVAALAVFAIVWAQNPLLFVKQSPPVTLVDITRVVSYGENASGYISGNLTSGCNICPLTIQAGSSASVEIGFWLANTSETPGRTVTMNWTLYSPYPFQAPSYHPPTPPLVYTWNDTDTVGPYGSGGFGITVVIEIPYAYTNLPPNGSISFNLNASVV